MAKPPHAERMTEVPSELPRELPRELTRELPPKLSPELAKRLQALDQQFRAGLRQRLAEVSGPDPAQVYAALHRLVGAAGAYGHTALAEQARQAMQALEAGQLEASHLQQHAQTAAMRAVSAEIALLMH